MQMLIIMLNLHNLALHITHFCSYNKISNDIQVSNMKVEEILHTER